MKNFFRKLFKNLAFDFVLVLLFVFAGGIYFLFFNPAEAFAQGYAPLAEIPGITDKGVPSSLGTYVNSIYTFSIGIGAVLAVLMIVIGGLQYMGTDIFSKKGEGRARITNAGLGLGLLLASFLILQTVNTNLIKLDLELDVATNTKKIGIVENADGTTSTLLTDENVGEFLEQQAEESIRHVENGFQAATRYCVTTVNNERNRTREKVTEDYFKCRDNLSRAIEDRGDRREYTDCTVVDSSTIRGGTAGHNITCYFFRERE